MAGIPSSIDGIFAHLKRLDRPVAARRRPGLPEEEIRSNLDSLGLACPSDLVAAYAACDGIDYRPGDILDDIHFFPGFYWMPLAECIANYKLFKDDVRWNRHWLPLFANGGGDFYAVICDPASPSFGAVVGFMLGEEGHLIEFSSLAVMFEVIERSFETKAFYEQGGYLETNYPEMRDIVRAVDPGFEPAEA